MRVGSRLRQGRGAAGLALLSCSLALSDFDLTAPVARRMCALVRRSALWPGRRLHRNPWPPCQATVPVDSPCRPRLARAPDP